MATTQKLAHRRPDRPELIIGIAGAVGVDTGALQRKLETVLDDLGYAAETIKVIDLIEELPKFKKLPQKPEDVRIKSRMQAGNQFRQALGRWDALAVYAMGAIRAKRQERTNDPNTTSENVAYIIRSLKNPEEVKAFRRVYGPAFILISAYSPRHERVERLTHLIASSNNDSANPNKHRITAEALVEIDANEEGVPFGQNLRDAFPLADVFVEVSGNDHRTEESLRKFFELLFRHPYHTPSRDEHGMFLAFSGALRSADMGRQVGAAIVDQAGDIVAIGTNEVPRPGGGQYWHGDIPDGRDFKRSSFAFDAFRNEILTDILERLKRMKWLAKTKSREDVSSLVSKSKVGMNGALYLDIIEYGRTVHAEMSAILGAARRGSAIGGATLYSTTFPCHECARNIVAAGITKVVYIHPYSKSRVESLFNDSISIDGERCPTDKKSEMPQHVEFTPFVGIAPRRYPILFDAVDIKRKENGKTVSWNGKKESPREVMMMRAYVRRLREQVEFNELIQQMRSHRLLASKGGAT